jgi:hypothetical protein
VRPPLLIYLGEGHMPVPAQAPADTTLGKLTLRVRGPAGTTQTVVLTSGCCRIGSGAACTLRLRAPGVRDVHCVIFRGPRRTTVRGLAKETWLNDAVFFESPLAVGDCLRLGRLEIDVLGDERFPAESPSPARLEDAGYGEELETRDRSAEDANSDGQPAEAAPVAPAPADCIEQLKMLVAGQTTSLSERSNATMNAELSDFRQELSQHQADLARLQEDAAAAQRASTSSEQQTLASLRALEQRLAGVDQRLGELKAASAAREEPDSATRWLATDSRLELMDRLLEQQRQENDACRQQLGETLSRLAEIAGAVAKLEESLATVTASGEETRALFDQWRRDQADERAPAADQQVIEQRFAEIDAELAELRRASSERVVRECPARPADLVEVRGTHLVSPEERQAWLAAAAPQSDDEEGDGAADFGNERLGAQEQTALEVAEAEEPKELAFEQVSKAAPLSTLDVLRRMGATIDLSDDEASVALPPARAHAGSAPAHPPANPSRPPAAPRHDEALQGDHHDDGESVEQYMSQLLERLRTTKSTEGGRNTAPLVGGKASAPAETAAQGAATQPNPVLPDKVEPLKPPTPRAAAGPRAVPPELTADLSAMRALANNTARQAIDSHRRRGQVRATQGKLLIAGVALLISFTLLWFSTGGSRLALCAAILSLLVSAYWIRRYFVLTRKARSAAKPSLPDAGTDTAEPQAAESTAR